VKPQVEQQARALANNPRPDYPGDLLATWVSGSVVLQFVIDTTGSVDKRSVLLVDYTSPEFATSCLQALYLMHYRPAELDHHKVRELVEQPFAFKMN
jgi:hypothetical protein